MRLRSGLAPYVHTGPRVSKRSSSSRRPAAPPPQLQDTVRLSADGLAKVLGDLEARVLRTVWALRTPVPARTVYERVVAEHPVALLTVITVLNKLVAKHVLTRRKVDDLLHYAARLTEGEFMAHASRRVVEGILSFSPDAVAVSFVDVLAERDPEQLAELGRLIRRRLGEEGRGTADAPRTDAPRRAAPGGDQDPGVGRA